MFVHSIENQRAYCSLTNESTAGWLPESIINFEAMENLNTSFNTIQLTQVFKCFDCKYKLYIDIPDDSVTFYRDAKDRKRYVVKKEYVWDSAIAISEQTQHSCQGRNHDDLQVIYERILSHGKVYVSQLIEPQRCTADDVLEYALKQIYKSMGAATVARLFESNAQHQKHIRNINDTVDRLLKEKRATHNIEGSSTNDFSVYEKKLCQNCVY